MTDTFQKGCLFCLFWIFKIAPPPKGLPLWYFSSFSEVFPKVVNLVSHWVLLWQVRITVLESVFAPCFNSCQLEFSFFPLLPAPSPVSAPWDRTQPFCIADLELHMKPRRPQTWDLSEFGCWLLACVSTQSCGLCLRDMSLLGSRAGLATKGSPLYLPSASTAVTYSMSSFKSDFVRWDCSLSCYMNQPPFFLQHKRSNPLLVGNPSTYWATSLSNFLVVFYVILTLVDLSLFQS